MPNACHMTGSGQGATLTIRKTVATEPSLSPEAESPSSSPAQPDAAQCLSRSLSSHWPLGAPAAAHWAPAAGLQGPCRERGPTYLIRQKDWLVGSSRRTVSGRAAGTEAAVGEDGVRSQPAIIAQGVREPERGHQGAWSLWPSLPCPGPAVPGPTGAPGGRGSPGS